MYTAIYDEEDNANDCQAMNGKGEPVAEIAKEQHCDIGQYEFRNEISRVRVKVHISKSVVNDINNYNKCKDLQNPGIVHTDITLQQIYEAGDKYCQGKGDTSGWDISF